jgi:ligand-binding sensor domain-containing protein
LKLRYWIILLLVLNTRNAGAQLYAFKNFNYRNGIAMTSVLSVAQDRTGYIWIGTDGAGLQKYDGMRFTHVQFPDTDNDHHVADIFTARNGDIYFTSLYKGFFRLETNGYRRLYLTQAERGYNLAMAATDSLLFFVASMDLLVGTEKQQLQHYRLGNGQMIHTVHQIIPLKKAAIVLTDAGAFYLHAKGIVPLAQWMHKSPEFVGRLVAGTYSGHELNLYSEDLEHQFTVVLNPAGQIHSCYKKLIVQHVLAPGQKVVKGTFRKNHLLLVTDRAQLIQHTGNGFKHIVRNTQDNIENVPGILIDRNNDFWLSTYRQGLYKVSLEPFTRLEIHPLYKDPYIGFCFKT